MARLVLAAAGLLAALAGPVAHAQGPVDAAAAMAEAPRFMQLTGKTALLDAFVERLRLVAIAMLGHGGLSFQQRAELADALIMPELHAASPGLLAQWTVIYATDLSADDMLAIEAFYATPAGQHLLATQTQVTNSLQLASLTWQTTMLHDAIAKHIDALRARGYQQ